jgi:small subunit ribosomal protein S8
MDSISNMIIKIKNANHRGLATVAFPLSKITFAIAELLEREGYLKDVKKKGKGVAKTVEASLVYNDKKEAKVTDVHRVSKLSKRVYAGVADIKAVRSGYGLLVLTTPKGVMTDKQAKVAKVGGEVLFKIW